MVQEMIQAARPKMEGAIGHYSDELKTLRTGRANTQMLDGVMVPYYGTHTPLKQLATLTVSDAQTIVIQPFDANAMNDIRQGIEMADLGFRPSDDGRVMRINIPSLTTERREELVKKAGKLCEECRISIRTIRGDVWEKAQEIQKKGEITEDQRDWVRDQIDKLVVEFNKQAEELLKEKEAEIRQV